MWLPAKNSGVSGLLAMALLGIASLAAPLSATADTARAECGFGASPEEPPESREACTFSQRQGYITIQLDGSELIDLRPVGDQPGNYLDSADRPVYRRSGLGEAGQIFQTPEGYLFVYWWREKWECTAAQIAAPDGCNIDYGVLNFSVQASSGSSLNQLRLTSAGLEVVNLNETVEIDGTAYRAEIADLDANGWPEIYVYVSSAGSGSYGSLVAYGVNNGKSATPVYLRPLPEGAAALEGYSGHDEFAVVERRLVRRFPVYRSGDSNAEPSGGMRQLEYQLTAGEAGWILEFDKQTDF